MQNIVRNFIIIASVLSMALLSIYFKDLRLGKDLRGGVSLVYTVQMDPDAGDRPQDVLQQIIESLKDRVNPRGVLDISMEPLGRDRIEVVMPLPTPEVQALAAAYEAVLRSLINDAEIAQPELDEALRVGEAVARFGGRDGTDRHRLVTRLQEAHAERNRARAELDQLVTDDEVVRREMEFSVAEATLDYRDLYEEVVRTSLPESRIRRTLALPTTPQRVVGADGRPVRDDRGRDVFRASLREDALDVLRADYPELAARLDELIASYEAFDQRRTGLDDPEDLIRLLRGAGVLEFRIATSAADPGGVDVARMRQQLREGGPENVVVPNARWFPVHQLEEWYSSPDELAALEADPVEYFRTTRDLVAARYDGLVYLALSTVPAQSIDRSQQIEWRVNRVGTSADQMGRPAVTFGLDQSGAALMGRLTGGSLGKPMAIVLDGAVYSAPTIQGQITSSGQITGKFTRADIDYLVRVLNAGALSGKLSEEPISISVLGPSIGADNLERGREAFIIALIAVGIFMGAYYFLAGLIANIALLINGILIFGAIMAIDGTFTLPGLAGIVLTIGMAVDANVLIYERIREELMNNKEDLRTSIRLGYSKALSTIIDGNVTNLIVCFALFQTATTEVKGFALTLTIGIAATLFTALFVTRQLFTLYTEKFHGRKLNMLPIAVPAIHRALEPNVNWIGMRPIFFAVSAAAIALSIFAIVARGPDLFDTEFRGGVSLVMKTRMSEGGERVMLSHVGAGGVLERVRSIGVNAPDPATADSPEERRRREILREMANATVYTVGDTGRTADGSLTAAEFQIKVASPPQIEDEATNARLVVEAISEEFQSEMDTLPRLRFTGDAAPLTEWDTFVTPIAAGQTELGQVINRPGARQSVAAFIGGVVIMIDDLQPPTTPEDVLSRISRTRNQPDFQQQTGRRVDVVGVTPVDPENPRAGYTEVAVLVLDPARTYLNVPSAMPLDRWQVEVPEAEWALVQSALARTPSLEQVSTFSSAIARTLRANAVVAISFSMLGILVYIWVRFGSLRYSAAAVVALVHDVTIALGILAATGMLAGTAVGQMLAIEPFRIELGVIAAMLTIIGYSLNDTIVVLDRIRENRGKRPLATGAIINRSINQTVSRTILTSGTTLLAVLIMYFEGGSGIRPFAFCLLVGILVGTYSSIAVAAPLVHRRSDDHEAASAPAGRGLGLQTEPLTGPGSRGALGTSTGPSV